MSRLRVAMVTPRYAPDVGGVERHVQELSEALTRRDVEVEILTTAGSAARGASVHGGVLVRRFPAWAPSGNYHASPSVLRYLRSSEHGYDVVHAHSYHSLTSAAAIVGRAASACVFTPHFLGTGHSAAARLLHLPYRRVGHWMLGRSAQVICVSTAERRSLELRFPQVSRKVSVIPNGVGPTFVAADESVARSPDRMLWVGRVERYKALDRVIGALGELPPTWTLTIVGGGRDGARLQRLAQRVGVSARIEWLGQLDAAALAQCYAKASVLVTLSPRECFGLAVLEARAAGCRVVAPDIPALRELADDVGGIELIDPDAPPSTLAGRVTSATSGPRPASLPARYRWDEIAGSTIGVYERALGHET